jgi:hypothetical protein
MKLQHSAGMEPGFVLRIASLTIQARHNEFDLHAPYHLVINAVECSAATSSWEANPLHLCSEQPTSWPHQHVALCITCGLCSRIPHEAHLLFDTACVSSGPAQDCPHVHSLVIL